MPSEISSSRDKSSALIPSTYSLTTARTTASSLGPVSVTRQWYCDQVAIAPTVHNTAAITEVSGYRGASRQIVCDDPIMSLEVVQTVASVSVPIVVAAIGYLLNRRLKLYEASQWRNQELIKARLQYFGQLAPMLNDLMCYLTFIGRWKELTPPEVLAVKREADRLFHTVAPLFSQEAVDAYKAFIDLCFRPFNTWGTDARIRSGYGRRRSAAGNTWRPEWNAMFMHQEDDLISESSLAAIQAGYNEVLRALVRDVQLLAPRMRYATAQVTINAH